MPCTYDPTPLEREASRKAAERRRKEDAENAEKAKKASKLEVVNHTLSVQLDSTRDLLFRVWEAAKKYDPDLVYFKPLVSEVEAALDAQTKHRQNDLDRLIRVLAKDPQKNRDLLKKVLEARPEYPLEEQLGFNPDDY